MGNNRQEITLRDVWGRAAYLDTLRIYNISSEFEHKFNQIQPACTSEMTGSKKIESLITRELLPVLDPDNKAESFLACNLIRHSRNSKDFVVDTANYDFLTRKNLFPGLPEKLFRRFAKKYKGSAFGDYCAFVTDHDSDIVKEMTKHPPSTRSIIFNTTFDGYLP